ncbi:MAG TPA: hypothetical protein VKU60_09195, partial [Chloroflexota bacterium]|nr:hypothetical protein [Chloroflexota bacterium]
MARLSRPFSRWGWAGVLLVAAILLGAAAPVAALESSAVEPAGASSNFRLLGPAPQPALPPAPSPSPASTPPLRWVYMVGSTIPPGLQDHVAQIDVLAP